DRHLLWHPVDRLDESAVIVAVLPEPLAIEEAGGQVAHEVGVARRQVQTQPQLFAVGQEDLRLRDRGLTLANRGRRILAEGGEDGFDMLAGAEGVGAKVGTGTGVVADVKAADADPILPARGRVGHLVVAEDSIAAEVLNAKLSLGGPLPAD